MLKAQSAFLLALPLAALVGLQNPAFALGKSRKTAISHPTCEIHLAPIPHDMGSWGIGKEFEIKGYKPVISPNFNHESPEEWKTRALKKGNLYAHLGFNISMRSGGCSGDMLLSIAQVSDFRVLHGREFYENIELASVKKSGECSTALAKALESIPVCQLKRGPGPKPSPAPAAAPTPIPTPTPVPTHMSELQTAE